MFPRQEPLAHVPLHYRYRHNGEAGVTTPTSTNTETSSPYYASHSNNMKCLQRILQPQNPKSRYPASLRCSLSNVLSTATSLGVDDCSVGMRRCIAPAQCVADPLGVVLGDDETTPRRLLTVTHQTPTRWITAPSPVTTRPQLQKQQQVTVRRGDDPLTVERPRSVSPLSVSSASQPQQQQRNNNNNTGTSSALNNSFFGLASEKDFELLVPSPALEEGEPRRCDDISFCSSAPTGGATITVGGGAVVTIATNAVTCAVVGSLSGTYVPNPPPLRRPTFQLCVDTQREADPTDHNPIVLSRLEQHHQEQQQNNKTTTAPRIKKRQRSRGPTTCRTFVGEAKGFLRGSADDLVANQDGNVSMNDFATLSRTEGETKAQQDGNRQSSLLSASTIQANTSAVAVALDDGCLATTVVLDRFSRRGREGFGSSVPNSEFVKRAFLTLEADGAHTPTTSPTRPSSPPRALNVSSKLQNASTKLGGSRDSTLIILKHRVGSALNQSDQEKKNRSLNGSATTKRRIQHESPASHILPLPCGGEWVVDFGSDDDTERVIAVLCRVLKHVLLHRRGIHRIDRETDEDQSPMRMRESLYVTSFIFLDAKDLHAKHLHRFLSCFGAAALELRGGAHSPSHSSSPHSQRRGSTAPRRQSVAPTTASGSNAGISVRRASSHAQSPHHTQNQALFPLKLAFRRCSFKPHDEKIFAELGVECVDSVGLSALSFYQCTNLNLRMPLLELTTHHLDSLEALRFHGTPMSKQWVDEIAWTLESSYRLRILDVSHTRLDPESVEILASGIATAKCLEELFIDSVTLPTGVGTAFIKAVSECPTIRKVSCNMVDRSSTRFQMVLQQLIAQRKP